MPEKVELETILKHNPQIDAEKLRESIELSRKLLQDGFVPRGYQLPPPFARKRAELVDNTSDDSRILRRRYS